MHRWDWAYEYPQTLSTKKCPNALIFFPQQKESSTKIRNNENIKEINPFTCKICFVVSLPCCTNVAIFCSKIVEIFSFVTGSPDWDLRIFPMALTTSAVESLLLVLGVDAVDDGCAGALLEPAAALSLMVRSEVVCKAKQTFLFFSLENQWTSQIS